MSETHQWLPSWRLDQGHQVDPEAKSTMRCSRSLEQRCRAPPGPVKRKILTMKTMCYLRRWNMVHTSLGCCSWQLMAEGTRWARTVAPDCKDHAGGAWAASTAFEDSACCALGAIIRWGAASAPRQKSQVSRQSHSIAPGRSRLFTHTPEPVLICFLV